MLNSKVSFQNYKSDREGPGAQHSPVPDVCPHTWMASMHAKIYVRMYWRGEGRRR